MQEDLISILDLDILPKSTKEWDLLGDIAHVKEVYVKPLLPYELCLS